MKHFFRLAHLTLLLCLLGHGAGLAAARVGVLLPSGCDDASWSQAMCEGLRAVAQTQPLELAFKEHVDDMSAAEATLRAFAEQNYDLIVAHGTQFQEIVEKLAPLFPRVSFAYGSGNTARHPNIFAYDPQPQEGAYLMGMAAGLVTRSNILALISPVDVSDAILFNRGFELGVKAANPKATVGITYTGLFNDLKASQGLAQAHIDAGADILSGSGQQAVGAMRAVAGTPGVFWLANDFDMKKLAPGKILASQSYDYKAILQAILKERGKGVLGGKVYPLALSLGNVNLVWSDLLAPEIRKRMEKLQADIKKGAFKTDIKVLRYDFWMP